MLRPHHRMRTRRQGPSALPPSSPVGPLAIRQARRADGHRGSTARMRRDLTSAAEAMPDADYGFKPTSVPEVRTFGETIAQRDQAAFVPNLSRLERSIVQCSSGLDLKATAAAQTHVRSFPGCKSLLMTVPSLTILFRIHRPLESKTDERQDERQYQADPRRTT
jgi:hypothetical protein